MAPPPGTWRSLTSPAAIAEHAAKFHLNVLPNDFEYTEEEKNLIQMYDTVKQLEREATRLKEKKARERIYSHKTNPSQLIGRDEEEEEKQEKDNDEVETMGDVNNENNIKLSPQTATNLDISKKRKAGRNIKRKKGATTFDHGSDDDESDSESNNKGVESDDEEENHNDGNNDISLADRRAAKLEALRDEVEEKRNAMKEEEETEKKLREELLATNEDDGLDEGRLLKRKRPNPVEEEGKPSLLSQMTTTQTPPHDFSEKLGIKSWKGTVLFPLTPREPTWTPPEEASNPNDGAFLVPLEDFDISKAQNGEGPNTLALKFTAPSDSKRFSFNIAGPRHNDFDSILFHFNPRQREKGGQLVINDKQKGVWGRAVQLPLSQVPLIFGQPSVTILVQINGDGFDVFVEGKHCARLEHRTELPSESCNLYLQFPSCDDSGKLENWKVFKAWWGNKESLVKEDISGIAGVNTFDSVHPRKLFVQGLPKVRTDRDVEIRRAELERAFRKYGGARGVSTLVPKFVSYAFVEFETEPQCQHALQDLADKFPYKLSRARRSKHEALMDARAAAASGNTKSAGDW